MTAERPAWREPIREGDPVPPDDRHPEQQPKDDIDRLYRTRADNLVRHFAAATDDHESASEVVHEAFAKFSALSLAKRLTLVRPDAYLYRICLNLFRDRHRDERNHSAEDEALPSTTGWHSPFAELEHRDTLRRLEKAMLRLSPKTREIFLAKRLDGMSYAEIAERTGLSIKGVEKHMSKAIATISRIMERDRP